MFWSSIKGLPLHAFHVESYEIQSTIITQSIREEIARKFQHEVNIIYITSLQDYMETTDFSTQYKEKKGGGGRGIVLEMSQSLH